MATWKKVIVSGSSAQLNQVSVDTSVNITGSLNASSSVFLKGLTNSSQATILSIDAATGQLFYQGTGSFTANSASYALSASYASNASTADSATSASYASNASTADNATSASRATSAASADSATSASYASNASTADSATSASRATSAASADSATSASYASNATSASYALNASNAISSSYALSASYAPGSDTSISASYAKNADTASSADNFTVRNQMGIGTAPVSSYPLYISSSANDESLGLDSSAAINAIYLLKGGDKKFEISFDTTTEGIFRLLPYSSSTFFEIGNPSNAGTDYVFISEKNYGNVLIGPGIGNGTAGLEGSVTSDKVQIKGDFYVSGSTKVLGGLAVKGLTAASASYLVAYDPTTGAMSYATTGSVVSATASFAISASHAENADNALTASKVANVLTAGRGVTTFSYDGSLPESVEISGSLGLTSNVVTKWTGDAFANSSITDSTNVTINNAGGVLVQTGGLYVTGSSIFHDSVTIQGNLTVAGTASFQHSDNLAIADQFILLNSGSTTFEDSGIIISTGNTGNSGSAFFLETAGTTTGTDSLNGRFAVAGNVQPNATTVTAQEYANTTIITGSAPGNAIPQFGGTGLGQGNTWVDTSTSDIWIYA